MNPSWTYQIDGNDIVVRNVIATCFGGKFDAGDNGQTESGILNDGLGPESLRRCAAGPEHGVRNAPLSTLRSGEAAHSVALNSHGLARG